MFKSFKYPLWEQIALDQIQSSTSMLDAIFVWLQHPHNIMLPFPWLSVLSVIQLSIWLSIVSHNQSALISITVFASEICSTVWKCGPPSWWYLGKLSERFLTFGNHLTCWSTTAGERIPNVALVADTDRNMVPYSAVGVKATQTRTRILALAVDAGQVGRTFWVDDALWPAVRRGANHIW